MVNTYQSWGRYPKVHQQEVKYLNLSSESPVFTEKSVIPYGKGRSYGDCCLNDGGEILSTERLDNFIEFDRVNGILRCESGVSLDQILAVIVPAGWFLPVTPGTQYITIGGAIANDIHGKNHHKSGTFGCFVRSFGLLRSSGERMICSPDQNQQYFSATIGGMGLTGLIVWAEIQLIKIESPLIDMESIQFESLDEFFSISASADQRFDYTVSWLDCVSQGKGFGRGIFMGGNHASIEVLNSLGVNISKKSRDRAPYASVPFDFPSWALNRYSVRAFNELYYRKQFKKQVRSAIHYRPFFYPLDAVNDWNRIYGSAGFVQFQNVIPKNNQQQVVNEMLREIVRSGQASFLAVIKEFGSVPSPGMMSFPQEGVTFALDFAFRGERTIKLMQRLEEITDLAGGRLYVAKDALMSAKSFKKHYPQWREFSSYVDPKFSSSFWRRVTAGG